MADDEVVFLNEDYTWMRIVEGVGHTFDLNWNMVKGAIFI